MNSSCHTEGSIASSSSCSLSHGDSWSAYCQILSGSRQQSDEQLRVLSMM